MKKVLLGFVALFAMLTVWSCGGATSSPTAVAEAAAECIKNDDMEGYVELIYIEEKEGKTLDEQRAELTEFLSGLMQMSMSQEKGLESYEVLSEEIAEDGKSAVVKCKMVYGDGSEDEDKIKMIKTEEGEWMIDMNK